MINKSTKIFEMGGPTILSDLPSEKCSPNTKHSITVSEEGSAYSQNGSYTLLRCCGDIRLRKIDWSTKQSA